VKNRLKEARFFKRKTQVQLFLETGIHFSTISRIEGGYVNPSNEQREKLACVLGVDEGWLFPKDGEKNE